MNLSKIRYSISQAKKNVIRNGLMSIASLFTISCCLFILGLFTVITFNVNSFTTQIKDQCEIQLFINLGTDENRVSEIADEILTYPNIKEVVFHSREELYEYAMNDVFDGKEELIGNYTEEDNPFSDSYKITLQDISLTSQTVSQLEKIADVSHIENKQDVTNIVISASNAVKNLSAVVMLILFMISIVIISNTVRLTVFNRRKEINIMKYIGATDRFIRIPFVIEGIMIGFLGAILSFALISWGYIVIYAKFAESSFDVFELIPYINIAPLLCVIFIVFGCLIGIIGSSISMRKYLKV
ncbi:MAG: permease-like cell division protein FtsX [Clostridia bacterium]|nr:permease-like cell division protein FtsX [Clostridia bacterium]